MSDWRDAAACLDAVDADFFPVTQAGVAYKAAREVCAGCPVAVECLDAAMTTEGSCSGAARFGMRGGLIPTERAARYRAQSRQATQERAQPPTPHEKAVTARAALAPILAEHAADTEARVRRLTIAGMSLTQIAQRMNISPRQVGRYRARLRAGVA